MSLNFAWNNEPIQDIEAWARERGEPMVKVRHRWRQPNLFSGQIDEREEVIVMPRCFAAAMRFGGVRQDDYKIIEDAA